MGIKQSELSETLSILRIFREAYKEENGVVTIGEIQDLVDKINLIEKCVQKQKHKPMKIERTVGIFGRENKVYCCGSCLSEVSVNHIYCPICGQKMLK